jgi:hypothetical protein
VVCKADVIAASMGTSHWCTATSGATVRVQPQRSQDTKSQDTILLSCSPSYSKLPLHVPATNKASRIKAIAAEASSGEQGVSQPCEIAVWCNSWQCTGPTPLCSRRNTAARPVTMSKSPRSGEKRRSASVITVSLRPGTANRACTAAFKKQLAQRYQRCSQLDEAG